MREQAVAQRVLLEAAKQNIVLWRNNVGACQDATGRLIRYGLGHDSAKQNEHYKSSDYIGICPTQAYVENIGWTTLGVFVAIETKSDDWRLIQSDKRAIAQAKFHDIVRTYGGMGGFATKPEDVRLICKIPS